jgi:inhibitor of cysteine peptidase
MEDEFKVARGFLVVLLLLSLMIAGCDGSGDVEVQEEDPMDANEVALEASSNGDRIEAQVGQVLVLTLESNPSTGYLWEVVKDGAPALEQVGGSLFKLDAEEGEEVPPGTGGWEVFRFEAKAAGETGLELVYHRPWEEGVEPLEVFSLQVVVR